MWQTCSGFAAHSNNPPLMKSHIIFMQPSETVCWDFAFNDWHLIWPQGLSFNDQPMLVGCDIMLCFVRKWSTETVWSRNESKRILQKYSVNKVTTCIRIVGEKKQRKSSVFIERAQVTAFKITHRTFFFLILRSTGVTFHIAGCPYDAAFSRR